MAGGLDANDTIALCASASAHFSLNHTSPSHINHHENSFNSNNNGWAAASGSAGDTSIVFDIKQPTHMVVVYVVTYIIIFVAALVGNTMVVAVVMLRPEMRNVTNFFIANLAVTDMLVAVFCIPLTLLDNIYYGWPFGAFLCKLSPYIQGVAVCASVYNLAAIAVDRCVAICFKPQFRITPRGAFLTIACIWVLSFAVMTPWLVYYQHFTKSFTQKQSQGFCQPLFPSYKAEKTFYISVIFLGTYLIPLLVVLLCYILIARKVWHRRAPGVAIGCNIIKRYKIKVIKMLVTVVAFFALSWLPLHVIYLLLYFYYSTDESVCNYITDIGVPVAQWLELSNSGMNAIIYCFFSENFRRGFVDLYRCVLRRPPIRDIRGNSSTMRTRRGARSLSEESTMMASQVLQRPNGSSNWKDPRQFLHMCAVEKRYVWRNGNTGGCVGGINGYSSAKSLDDNKSNHSFVQKYPKGNFKKSRSQSLNDEQSIAQVHR